MTLARLSDVLETANAGGYAVAGMVCLGWEDARAYARAAELEGCPVILQAGPSCRKHTPLPVLGAMFRNLAERVTTPVVAHLDHGASYDECAAAIDAGFTSVMYDGSRLPLDENIATTADIVAMAHKSGLSCEGEIGFVGYAEGAASERTDPEDAARFARETGVDAMAVSVGNVHLQKDQGGPLDEDAIRAIEAETRVPLVIHGGSGVPNAQRTHLARGTRIAKFNIGTELRMVFGRELRATLASDPEVFDRIEILSRVEPALTAAARRVIRGIGPATG